MLQLVESLDQCEPTYAEIGATLDGLLPEGFHHDRYERSLGRGTDTFQRAVHGLRTWKAHQLPGVRVFPVKANIESGASVVVTLGTPYLALAAPCRIVRVVDSPTQWGFAYGTLPDHPEQGEEAFIVSTSGDETVQFKIIAFSRPGDPLVRLSGPVGRGIQKCGPRGYLRALRRYVGREA